MASSPLWRGQVNVALPVNICAMMTRQLAAIALLLLIARCAHAQAAPLEVPNAGFEQVSEASGMPAGWTPWTPAGTAAYTLAIAHTGVASARITDTDANRSQGLRSGKVAIQGGRTYEAAAWVNITDLQQAGFAVYLEFWIRDQRVQDTSAMCTTGGQWAPVTVRARAPEGATMATILVYGSTTTVGEAYFDDVTLTEIP